MTIRTAAVIVEALNAQIEDIQKKRRDVRKKIQTIREEANDGWAEIPEELEQEQQRLREKQDMYERALGDFQGTDITGMQ